ncbi:MAG: NYN domain-containing protein [Selenomonadaceae bacterium]|nr:NYN domain-containing protein [Selenomonadaceae bacterium]
MAAKKIALFIDADNISPKYGKQIVAAVESRGEVFIRRIYGNWEKISLHGWNDCILNFSLRAVQQPDFVTGKNATDMSLTIDAMDVLHEGKAEIFALVSNDSDFTPLVIRLREGGMTIIGLGNANASNAFRAACSEFIDLDDAPEVQKPIHKPKTPATRSAAQDNSSPVQMSLFAENPAPEVKPAHVEPERPASSKVVSITRATAAQNDDRFRAIHEILHETARIHADRKGFVAMCWAGQSLHNQLGISVKDFGYGSLYKFVADFPNLYEMIHRDNGNNFCYRCRTKLRPAPVKNVPVKNVPVISVSVEERLPKFHDALREATTTCADEEGFANLCTVGTFLNPKEIGFGVKSLGYGTLQKFIVAFPDRYEIRHVDDKIFIRCLTDDERSQKLHDLLRETAAAHSDDTGFTDLTCAGNFSGRQLLELMNKFPDRYEIRRVDDKIFYRCISDAERVQNLHDLLRETAATNADNSGFTDLSCVEIFGVEQLLEFVSKFPDRYEIRRVDEKIFYRCISDAERVQKLNDTLRETAATNADAECVQKLHDTLRETAATNSDDERVQKLHDTLRETAATNLDDERVQKLHDILRETAAARADDSGFTDLSYVGNSLGKQKIGFGIRSLGYGTLQKFVADFPDRYELRKTDKKAFYRCRANESTAPVDNRLNQLHDILREAATAQHDDDGFSLLNHAGQQIKRKHLNFSIRDFGYGQLHEFVSAFPDRYEVAHDTNGGKFRYRCKPSQK